MFWCFFLVVRLFLWKIELVACISFPNRFIKLLFFISVYRRPSGTAYYCMWHCDMCIWYLLMQFIYVALNWLFNFLFLHVNHWFMCLYIHSSVEMNYSLNIWLFTSFILLSVIIRPFSILVYRYSMCFIFIFFIFFIIFIIFITENSLLKLSSH